MPKEGNHIRPEMKSSKFLVHLPMKDFWKKEIGECKNKGEAGTGENSLADVTFGKVCMLPSAGWPARTTATFSVPSALQSPRSPSLNLPPG
jgi:hypothetical protein